MNTVKSGTPNAGPVKNYPKTQIPGADNEPNVQTKNSTKNPAELKALEKNRGLTQKQTTAAPEGKKTEDQLGINEYLKIISRLENKLGQGELSPEDLQQITSSLETKILALPDVQKTRLRNMELFKKNGIDNIKDLKKTLSEMFNDMSKKDDVFAFLKSPEFMSVLLNEPGKPMSYSPPVGLLQNTPVKV